MTTAMTVALASLLTSSCTSSAASSEASQGRSPGPAMSTPAPDGGEPSLQPGSYPVATPPADVRATPTVSPGQYSLVAAGVPVRAALADGGSAVLTALGPEVTLPTPAPARPPDSAPGVLTVRVNADRGSVAVSGQQFVLLDETRAPVPLRAEPPDVRAVLGSPAELRLSAQLGGGHTTLTWQPAGRPLVTWDFVVELD